MRPMRGIKLLPNAVASAVGLADGVVKNWDLARGRTQPLGQVSFLLEAAGLVGGVVSQVSGGKDFDGGALLYGSEALLAQRAGMWAGQKLTGQGPGRQVVTVSSDTAFAGIGSPLLPVGPAYVGGGGVRSQPRAVAYGRSWRDGKQGAAIYPARREPAGILG